MKKEEDGDLTWLIDPVFQKKNYRNVHVWQTKTSRGQTIPLFFFPYPGAVYTVIFSHGNATGAWLIVLGILRIVLPSVTLDCLLCLFCLVLTSLA